MLRAAFIENTDTALNLLRAIKTLKALISPDDPVYLFIGVNAWDVWPSDLAGLGQKLGPDYRVLRPDEIIELLKEDR